MLTAFPFFIMYTKKCNKCKEEKSLEDFHINNAKKDRRQNICKPCIKQQQQSPQSKNLNKIRYNKRLAAGKFRESNKKYRQSDLGKSTLAKYYQSDNYKEKCKNRRNKQEQKERAKQYRSTEEFKQKRKQQRKLPENKIKERNYEKNKLKNDINFKLRKTLRNRLRDAIKENFKTGSAIRDLGCNITELKMYLEKLFLPGMSWDNHGKWHIDHIIPLSSFDLQNPNELKIACHFTNLQPLWAADNLKKGDKTYGHDN